MRFREFAPRPILRIGQRQLARQAEIQRNIPPTASFTNQQPTPASVRVYPRQWQHEWVQKYLAARMAGHLRALKRCAYIQIQRLL